MLMMPASSGPIIGASSEQPPLMPQLLYLIFSKPCHLHHRPRLYAVFPTWFRAILRVASRSPFSIPRCSPISMPFCSSCCAIVISSSPCCGTRCASSRVQKPLGPPLRLPAPDRRSTGAPALVRVSVSKSSVNCRATLTHPVGECVSAAMLARPYCDDPLSHHPGSPSHRPAEIHHSRVSWPVPGHQTRPANALYRDMGQGEIVEHFVKN